MKRAPFVMLPMDPADAWFSLRYADRALGADLFRVFGNTETLNVRIEAVPDVVCRRLAVDGRDRPSVRRSLARLVEAGLLVADGDRTLLLYSAEAYSRHHERSSEPVADASPNVQSSSGERAAIGRPMTSERPVNVQSSVSERPVNDRSMSGDCPVNVRSTSSETELSARNSSGDASYIRLDKIIKSESEKRARDASDGFEGAVAQVRREFARRFEAAEGSLWTRAIDPAVETVASWLLSLPGDRTAALTRTLDTFFADPWVRKEHYPIGHLARHPQKYHEPRALERAAPDDLESLRREAKRAVIEGRHSDVDSLRTRIGEVEARQEGSRRGKR